MCKLIINKHENICIGIYWNVIGVFWQSSEEFETEEKGHIIFET